jgi:uncharacterized protein (TIGR02246 family)
MSHREHVLILTLATFAAGGPTALGQTATESARAADKPAVEKRTRGLLDAIARGDAREVASFWTTDGEYQGGDGRTVRGRDNLEKAYRAFLEKGARDGITVHDQAIRFLSRDTAIDEGRFRVKGKTPADRASLRYSALYVRDGGEWRLAQLREWSEGPSLQDLDWLIGTWSLKTDRAESRFTFDWTEGKTFILGRFSVKRESRTVTGIQVVGRDPSSGAIRSWTFGSEGGIEEATWVRQEKRWVIAAKGVLPDGEGSSATNYLTPVDENTFTWQTVDRVIDGEKAPDAGPNKIIREKVSR